MWLFYALLTPFFFGIVHVLDEHCVDEIFEKPWIGVVTGAIASMVVFLGLPYLAPVLNWVVPTPKILIFALLSGVLIQGSVFLYFNALRYSEAGIVAAYWNMVPAFVPIISFFVLGEILNGIQYIGIIILIIASASLCLLDANIRTRWIAFFLMFISAILQSITFLLEDVVFESIPYSEGFYIITFGLILSGFIPLLFREPRNTIRKNTLTLSSIAKLILFIEIINLAALATTQKAVDLGIPSLVAAVESTIPAYTFIIGFILFTLGSKYGNSNSIQRITSKLLLVCLMVTGVILVS
ncbi:MAG: EamA family transporter [Candidatus Peribacteraceae bacterium]|nr:EamA family transporter [Candidatus Peribacteraceae bacterium]